MNTATIAAVSYTHLDVYKRQVVTYSKLNTYMQRGVREEAQYILSLIHI